MYSTEPLPGISTVSTAVTQRRPVSPAPEDPGTSQTKPASGVTVSPTMLIGHDRGEPDELAGLGGKGRALAELALAGFPVPRTGVVTTTAYLDMATDSELVALTKQISEGKRVSADVVDQSFATAPLDENLADKIVALAQQVGRGEGIAVRSSATVEDLHGSSFAGQYRSLLDVDSSDPEAVLTAVRQVWASLWHPAPSAYRRAFGIEEADVAMAVVLMEMIPATTAGVVFTADPGGSEGARVEAVDGLGESLVSGDRTPRAWVVPSDDHARTDLPAAAARALELALEVETAFGIPEDVEWAAVDDDVYVVQARPITVLDSDDGFDTSIDDHELTTGGIVEMVPGVLPPLRWEINRFLLEEAFRSVLDSLGIIRGLGVEGRPFVRRVRGRAAIDFDQLRAAATDIPGAVEELEIQYFGTKADPAQPAARPGAKGRIAAIKRDLLTLRTRSQVVDQSDVLISVTEQLRRRRRELADDPDQALLAYVRRLVDLSARGLAAELGVAAAAAASYQRLELLLSKHLESAEGNEAQVVTSGGGINVHREAWSSAAVYGGPTWSERGLTPPTTGDDGRRAAARLDASLAELEQRLTSQPGWHRRRILTGQFVDIRVHVVRRAVVEVVDQLHRREAAKAAVLELGGEVRRVHLELGRRLTERGLLDRATDIEFLTTGELAALVEDDQPVVGRDVILRRRNWHGRYEAEGALPIRFTGIPDREPEPLPEGDVLEGWGASPGRCRGPAKVVTEPEDELAPGDIIVAAATDASWSPLFIRAGGVVVERGGPLSHAAILARELGLPCVMNVTGATRRLAGCTVSIDGDRGVVVIEAEPGSAHEQHRSQGENS